MTSLIIFVLICCGGLFLFHLHVKNQIKISEIKHQARLKKIKDDHEKEMELRFPIWKEALLLSGELHVGISGLTQKHILFLKSVNYDSLFEIQRRENKNYFPYNSRHYVKDYSSIELYSLTTNENIILFRPKDDERDSILFNCPLPVLGDSETPKFLYIKEIIK